MPVAPLYARRRGTPLPPPARSVAEYLDAWRVSASHRAELHRLLADLEYAEPAGCPPLPRPARSPRTTLRGFAPAYAAAVVQDAIGRKVNYVRTHAPGDPAATVGLGLAFADELLRTACATFGLAPASLGNELSLAAAGIARPAWYPAHVRHPAAVVGALALALAARNTRQALWRYGEIARMARTHPPLGWLERKPWVAVIYVPAEFDAAADAA